MSTTTTTNDTTITTSALQLSAEEFKRAFPKQYLSHFLKSGIRLDGRTLNTIRPTVKHTDVIKTACSSSTIQRGNTVATCGLKMEVCHPSSYASASGKLIVNVIMPALSFANADLNKPTDESIQYSEFLTNFIISNKVISLNDLCIQENIDAWVIYADIVFLSYDGSPLPICYMALLESLSKLYIPATIYEDDKVVITGKGTPLPIYNRPWLHTYSTIDGVILADPNCEEEGSYTTIGYNSNKEICGLLKTGIIANEEFENIKLHAKSNPH